MAYPRRKKKSPEVPVFRWISFVLFVLIILMLALSLIKKQRPDKFLSDIFKPAYPEGSMYLLKKEELVHNIEQLDSIRQVLEKALLSCEGNGALQKVRIKVDSDYLNMRSQPDINSSVVIRIPKGQELYLIYCMEEATKLDNEKGSWCKVRYEGKESWVWGNYLEYLNKR